MNERELALDIFLEAQRTGRYVTLLLREVLDKYDYEAIEKKAFLKRLTEGTMERRISLDWVIGCYSKTPVGKMKPLIRELLRLGVYQILYMEAPDSAACNEAVKLAKKRGFSSLSGFVNGVLRSIARNRDSIVWPDGQKDPLLAMSVRYNLPEWLLALWRTQYGESRTEKLAAGIGQERPVTIRFREGIPEGQLEDILGSMCSAGINPRRHPLHLRAYELENCYGVTALPGFVEGMFYVQDVSSMLAVEAAGIGPGMRVLDLCAAPGGKAVFVCEKVKEGVVWAGDLSDAKAEKIRENARRMGCERMQISVWDATQPLTVPEGWADVVLADLPCSGLGVMGRKKEIRYRVSQQDLEALICLQRQILTASWRYVKPGGVLLYSTCTMNRGENEEMVRYVTDNFPFETESLDAYLPESLRSEQTGKGMLQLFCGEYDTDGFFMARLRRKQSI